MDGVPAAAGAGRLQVGADRLRAQALVFINSSMNIWDKFSVVFDTRAQQGEHIVTSAVFSQVGNMSKGRLRSYLSPKGANASSNAENLPSWRSESEDLTEHGGLPRGAPKGCAS